MILGMLLLYNYVLQVCDCGLCATIMKIGHSYTQERMIKRGCALAIYTTLYLLIAHSVLFSP